MNSQLGDAREAASVSISPCWRGRWEQLSDGHDADREVPHGAPREDGPPVANQHGRPTTLATSAVLHPVRFWTPCSGMHLNRCSIRPVFFCLTA
jgi:hypothetical protein